MLTIIRYTKRIGSSPIRHNTRSDLVPLNTKVFIEDALHGLPHGSQATAVVTGTRNVVRYCGTVEAL